MIALAAVTALLSVKAKADVSFHQNRLKIAVTWFAVPIFKREYTVRRDDKKYLLIHAVPDKGKTVTVNLSDLLRFTAPRKKKTEKKAALIYLYKKASFDIKIRFVVGTGDAMLTALSCGFLNGVIGALYAMRGNRKIKLKSSVVPEFSKQNLRFEADCIIKAFPVHIMIGYMISKKIIRR